MLDPTEFDLEVAARTLAQEARSEPTDAKQAVVWVMRNRVVDGRWGRSLASVCLWNWHIPDGGQGFQFSGWRGQDPNFSFACELLDSDAVTLAMKAIVQDIMARDGGADFTDGATHYYNPLVVPVPAWVTDAIFCGKFGEQLFYKGVK